MLAGEAADWGDGLEAPLESAENKKMFVSLGFSPDGHGVACTSD
jgi:hypothetical protein